MTMPTTSIRVACKQALYELIRDNAPFRYDGSGPVQVLYGPNIRELENESIWIGAIEGRQEFAVFGAPRARRNDSFLIDVWCGVRIPLVDDQYAADGQVELQLHAVEEILATSPGIGTSWTDVIDGVLNAGIEDFNGPSPADLSESGLGVWHSAAVLRVRVNTRLN
jgi:hypothetical protein